MPVVWGNSGSEAFAFPVQATVLPDVSSVPCHCQFWLELWLRWISRTPEPVNATVGVSPLSYWRLADQVISPSARSCPVWYQSVVAACDRWTSTTRPDSSSAIAGV
ncbi:hypothetical protein [Amycolatopsis sp. FDAARGOS 1241]|uniref:hypothetical protein n=1 Tax=Amycolatopsis sp. FDAARGOS 1241 TaxID=2778070 RepID=UPI001EF2652E|nr:hypothetical protein [Amycolatopsis sp. FDAARGOS 1241]